MTNLIIFIITNGRPDNIQTLKTLSDSGNTHPIYLVIDNEDTKGDEYQRKYPGKVKVFDKALYGAMVDHYDNFNNLRSTTHARNACFDIAAELGFTYFLVLDDDYTSFKLRINNELNHPKSCPNMKRNLGKIFSLTLEYFINSNFTSICFSQGGDWFGGEEQFGKAPKRKAMNTFFCSTDRPFKFVGRINEDVNTYTWYQGQGNLFMTIPFIQMNQMQTQSNAGGMTSIYLDGGTYVKSFYSIICSPNCTKINTMGRTNRRLHHLINWNAAAPCIIEEKYKK